MVAIFTGAGAGLERGSGSTLGGAGLLGSASLGRNGEQVAVNGFTGNLLISQRDEFLVGRGPDLAIARTYNSLGDMSDDNGDNWRQSTDRRVYGLAGTLNVAGSTVRRVSADGSDIVYAWNAAANAYTTTEGAGTFDKLTSSGGVWTWTDGDSQMRETYAAYNSLWRISQQIDPDGNALSFTYTGANLTRVTTADGSYTDYSWSGNNITQMVTSYTDLATSTGKTLTRTRYFYDASNRLTSVKVDLSPENNDITDGKVYVTTYTYVGTSRRVESIAQSDGSLLTIGYDSSGRVTSLTQTAAPGATRITTIAYNGTYTLITDPTLQVTRLDYFPDGSLAKITAPPAQGGAVQQTTQFEYVAAGSVAAPLINSSGSQIAGGTVTKTAATGWANQIAYSDQLMSGAATVQFKFDDPNMAGKYQQAGLSTYANRAVGGTIWSDGGFAAAIYFDDVSNALMVFDGVEWTRTAVTGVSSDVWTISYNGTKFDFLKNGVLFHSRAAAANLGLVFKHRGGTQGAVCRDISFSTLAGSWANGNWTAAVAAPLTNSTGSQITGGTVSKTTATGWANQIAYSGQLMSGTATVQFKLDDPHVGGKLQQAGLSTFANKAVAGSYWADGGFAAALYFDDTSGVAVFDGVEWTRTAVTGVSSDVWTISYDGAKFDFLKNGVLFHSRAAAANLGLVFKHRAYSQGAVCRDISFSTLAGSWANGSWAGGGRHVSKVTDALGNSTTYGYDAGGNVATVTDRLGNTTWRSYGAKNELLTEWRYGSYYWDSAGQLSTRYVYDAEGHLRYTIGADASVTEYRYSAAGDLDVVIEYPEHPLTGVALPFPNSVATEAQLNAWRDALPDRSSTKITTNQYDARGNLTQVNRHTTSLVNGGATAAGGISRTYHTYDQAGQLLKRFVDGELPETFVYDGLGRVIASTDANQATTNIVFNDSATQTVVTLANGYVKTSTYNKAGNLLTETQSGSYVAPGTATSKYDKLGRLRQVTDATGFNNYFVYDKVGRLVAEVNNRGDLVEYRYDSNDRLVATMRYINGVTGANLTTLANPDSTIEMSALRPPWHPWDVSSWTTYDKEGRVTSTMDGTIRTYEYDASGRLVRTVAYYNGLDWNQLLAFQANPPATPVIPTADARDVVTRIFYDALGRESGRLDGEGYLTFNVYDLAGQLVERIAYFNRANAAYRATGVLGVLIANQQGSDNDRRTHFAYDAQGLLRYEVDAHNQVVEYGYNAANKPISTTRYAGSIVYTTDFTWDNIKALVTSSGLASAPTTRRSWNVYNDSGQLSYAIDPEGAVAAYFYNNSGQVTKTVQFAVARPTSTWPDSSTMNAWSGGQNANAANRVTRYYYTAAGQLKFTVDAEGYISRTDYDGAGRTIGQYRWGNPVSVSDSTTIANVDALQAGIWTGESYTYEFGGPLTDIVNAEGGWHRYNYFQTGQKIMEHNVWADSNYTYYNYDNFGRLGVQTNATGAPEGGAVQYLYDGLGNIKTVTDARGFATNRTFDKLGRVLTETDALGGVVSYEYNAFGEVTKVTDARGYATTKAYDRLGRLVSTTDALNNVTTNSYNVFGDLLTVTRGAATTSFDYDRLGRVVKTTDAEGHYEQYTLDAFGNRTQVRNKLGGWVYNSFDRRGLLVAEILPMSSTDANGNVVATVVTNKFNYDARGNRIKKIEAFGLAEVRTTIYVYDRLDRLVDTIGDAVWTMNSDWVNSAVATPSEKLKYDHRSRVTERTDALGGRTLYYYDQMGNVTAEIGAAGTYTAFTYDKNGNVLTRRVYGTAVALPGTAGGAAPAAPGGAYRETVYTYDSLNRLKTTSVANIRTGAWNGTSYATSASATVTTTLDYDSNGNVVRTVDGNGVAAFAYYDKQNRKIAEVDREGFLTFYTLDGEGNVTREDRYAAAVAGAAIASDPNALRTAAGATSRVTLFTYDKNGRRLTETRLSVNAHALDGNGNVVAGAANSIVSYSYNGLGEVTQKTEANGDYISYTYDSTGRLLEENRAPYADQNGASVRPTISYGYNGLNELSLTRQGGVAAAAGDRYTRYTYAQGGRVATMTDANGAIYTYYYDVAGNVMRESYSRYKADGNYTIDSLLYQRDQLGRVVSQGLASWNGSAWVHGDRQNTAYNSYGEVAQRGVNGMWQEQLTYDGAGRLVKSNSGDGVWRFFAYDGNGNQTLTLESEGADLAAHSVDQAIAAATAGGSVGGAWVDNINATIAVFDKRGQQTATRLPFRELKAGTIQTVTSARAYNAYGEVTSETDSRGFVTDFVYNMMGRLTQKQSPNVAYTSAAGVTSSARPTENYYYDVSGRMIAADDANGNRVRRSLLAGSGHGGSEALVTAEYHADGGVFRTWYDVFGDARILRDELGYDEVRAYDAMGRLTQQNHRGGLLVDYYAYDLLGQRIKHSNSLLGAYNVETTDYDMQGRVLANVSFGGETTAFSYTWNAGLVTSGMGNFGGWTKVAFRPDVGANTTQIDMYGRDLVKSDVAGHISYYNYDKAGRLTYESGATGQSQTFTYFNTGRVATIADSAGTGSSLTGTANSINATYGYDANGNRILEKYAGQVWKYDYVAGHILETVTLQDGSITYDALGRITAFSDQGGVRTFDTDYDLAGNIRRSREKYDDIAGAPGAPSVTTDKWFLYDTMNRMVLTDGKLVGGAIVRGETGVALTYDAAGRRRTATHQETLMGHAQGWIPDPPGGGGGPYVPPMPGEDPPPEGGHTGPVDSTYTGDRREEYYYRDDGYLMTIKFADQDYDGTGAAAVAIQATKAAVNRGVNARDAMGRVTSYQEYDDRLIYSYNRFNVVYDAASRVTHEEVSSAKWETGGTATYLSKTDNSYGAGGVLSSTAVTNFRNNVDGDAIDTLTTYTYETWDEAKVKTIKLVSNTAIPSVFSTSTHYYDGQGRLASVDIGARRHAVSFASSPTGQVLRRLERSTHGANPLDHYFYVDGVQVGELSNNGGHDPSRDDYTGTIQTRTMKASTSDFPFRWNQYGGQTAGQFGGSGYDPISPGSNGMQGSGSRYTVRDGDTLAGIAQQVWGDASLWYMIAEANGLSAGQALPAGASLTIPDKVTNLHNNSGNFQVYDPNRAFGDLSPTTATTTSASPPKKANKCGMFGVILLIAIAVAVTVVTAGAALAAMAPATFATVGAGITGFVAGTGGFGLMVAAGAIGGAVGSIASQGFGVATGLQDKFSWKAVAMAGISGAVSAGVGASGVFARVGSTFVRGALSGATSSALTQGIGVAVGLQKKFDFAGVAAAGIGGGVSASVGGLLKAGSLSDLTARNIGANLASSTASAIANAATRSVIQGTDFGDNLMAALPDVIGSTIGNMIGGAMAGRSRASALAELGERSKPSFAGAELAAPQGNVADLLTMLPGVDLGLATDSNSDQFSLLEPAVLFTGAFAERDGANFVLASQDPFGDPWMQDQMRPYSLEGVIEGLGNGLSTATRNQYNRMVQSKARSDLQWAINNPETSPIARSVLSSFLTGEGPREFYFGPNSAGIKELFDTSPGYYYRREEIEAMRYMAYKSYKTGDLRNGYQVNKVVSRDFNPADGLRGYQDGIHLGDITGTFSSGLAAQVRGDRVYFRAENNMSLESYAGGNLIPVSGRYIDNPARGPLSTVRMIFEWSRPIPPNLRRKN